MSKSNYTKENIKARMFNRIATLWDIRSIDVLDPVVKLLVESLASEMFRLSGEIEEIEDRVVEKLARAFTPAFMMSASPAHAVIHARAAGETSTVDTNSEFAYKNPHFIQKHNLRKLAFTPIQPTRLIDGDVIGMVADGRYYNITAQGGKEHTANSLRRDPIFNNTVWLGIDINRCIDSIQNLPFYFEFPLMEDCEQYLRLLGYARWSHNGKVIDSVSGLLPVEDDNEQSLFGRQNTHSELNEGISGKYDNQFVTLRDTLRGRDMKWELFPAELIGQFDQSVVAGLTTEVVWLKAVFPPAFDHNALSQVVIHTNCFPAANIYKKQSITTVTKLSSIIPLEKEENEHFLFVDSMTDSRNRRYKEVRSHGDDDTTGTYMVRYGGSERFNHIDARDFLERLLDKYREESIAFSSIDIDILATSENLMAYLKDFDRKLRSYDGDNEHVSYIILGDNIKERTNLTVTYSVTNGTVGNNIRKSDKLEMPENADIDPASPVLMTTTRGGRKSPPESTQKDIYQYLLMSRDRVYTKEDMKLFCRAHYGDCFTGIEISNGYEVSNKPKEGIIRTTDIILSGTSGRSDVDPSILKRDILAGLRGRSPEGVNYRIILK